MKTMLYYKLRIDNGFDQDYFLFGGGFIGLQLLARMELWRQHSHPILITDI